MSGADRFADLIERIAHAGTVTSRRGMLIEAFEEIDRRLRVLEPCDSHSILDLPGEEVPHAWERDGKCRHCKARRSQ